MLCCIVLCCVVLCCVAYTYLLKGRRKFIWWDIVNHYVYVIDIMKDFLQMIDFLEVSALHHITTYHITSQHMTTYHIFGLWEG